MRVSEPPVEATFGNLFPCRHKIFQGDALETLKHFKNGKVHLVITSPPYNVGKPYENRTDLDEYLAFQKEVISELVRVLADTGSICWQVGNFVADGEVYPLDILFYNLFKDHGLQLRNRMVWHFGHGLHASKRFSGRYETILWFTKSDNYVFNLDPVRIPSKYPGKRHFKGPKKGQLSGNPLGKNPSDVWETLLQDWERELWDIPNVKANHPEKTDHPCQFPVELVERCLLALTNEGDWVLDPFIGVGTSVIAALKNDRNGVGIEKEKLYVDIAEDNIIRLKEGRLKIRPITKRVHQPSGREKVARWPKEWQKTRAH